MGYNKILIAVDDSPYGLKAAENGIALANKLNAQVALVFIIDKGLAIGNVDAGILPNEALMRLKKEAQETIDQIIKMYNGKHEAFHFTPEGNPKEEIIAMAQEWKADLIVMGTHGRTGLKHLLMGSVSESVIQHSKIPVMVVP
jgi:nucleotide-binding universal stress UspA family protein